MYFLKFHLFLLLATAVAANSATPLSGLYGLSDKVSLIRRNIDGTWITLGDALPYEQAQQLSCIDSLHEIFYMIGYDMSVQQPRLVGLSLFNGSILTETLLPFIDQTYIGIGQYITPHTSGHLFVGGQDINQNHIIGLVNPRNGNFDLLVNLSNTYRDVFGGTSVFIPETNELWFELDLDIMILNITSRKVTILPVNMSFSILGMNLDQTTGRVIGLDGGPGQGIRTIVSLDPNTYKVTITGSVPDYANQMGGMTAYDMNKKTIFWIAQKESAPSNSPWYLVQNEATGGKVITAESICENGGKLCPWSLHFFNAD